MVELTLYEGCDCVTSVYEMSKQTTEFHHTHEQCFWVETDAIQTTGKGTCKSIAFHKQLHYKSMPATDGN